MRRRFGLGNFAKLHPALAAALIGTGGAAVHSLWNLWSDTVHAAELRGARSATTDAEIADHTRQLERLERKIDDVGRRVDLILTAVKPDGAAP